LLERVFFFFKQVIVHFQFLDLGFELVNSITLVFNSLRIRVIFPVKSWSHSFVLVINFLASISLSKTNTGFEYNILNPFVFLAIKCPLYLYNLSLIKNLLF